tara:strand:- start:698 stop:1111 length:414 start_codon:yes stop_codon:yes gene_type:complete
MADMKTVPTEKDVTDFINKVEDSHKKEDCFELLKLMEKVSGFKPKMWGPSIIGFGTYHYKYESGREGDFFLTGFAPRKQNLAIYNTGFSRYEKLAGKLGKFKTGKGCLYVKRLSDIDTTILSEMISKSIDYLKKKYE